MKKVEFEYGEGTLAVELPVACRQSLRWQAQVRK